MNARQRRTLAAIFDKPERADIEWRNVESLFKALGARVREGNGSRVRVRLNDVRAVFHEPHPERVICEAAVKDVRRFLENAGVTPEDVR